jgi:hypothetical protein
MILTDITVNHKGIRYWFEENNRRDKYMPHVIQILVNNKTIIDRTCTCTHGTIQIGSKFEGDKTCTHLRGAINYLKERGILK